MDNAEKEKIRLYKIMAGKKRRECFDYFKNYHEEDLGDNTVLRISSDNDLMGKNAITSTIVTLEKKIVISGNKIKLFRSVFFGDVSIQIEDGGTLSIDDCFIFGVLSVNCNENGNILVNGLQVDSTCILGNLSWIRLSNYSVGTLSFLLSNVSRLDLILASIQSLRFSLSCVTLKQKVLVYIGIKNSCTSTNITDWTVSLCHEPSSSSNLNTIKNYETCDNIFTFLKANGFISSPNDYAEWKYQQGKINLSKCGLRIYKAVGGFIKPEIMFIWLLGIILVFALIYWLLGWKCNTMIENCSSTNMIGIIGFFKGLYFSIITLSTVGYGDIVPVGAARIFAPIEGLLGLFIGGTTMLSITRKYFDK